MCTDQNPRLLAFRRGPWLVLALALAWFLLMAAAVQPKPLVGGDLRQATVCTELAEWDFGNVDAGPILTARFPVHNQGSRRLVVHEKSRSCDCARARNSTLIIPPGGTDFLEARLETNDLHGPLAIEIEYATNDRRRPTISFALLANIRNQALQPTAFSPELTPISSW